jgi:hypothetical protein
MSLIRQSLLTISAVFVAACAGATSDPPPLGDLRGPPFVLGVDTAAGETLRVRATARPRDGWPYPVRVSFVLPEGVRARGAARALAHGAELELDRPSGPPPRLRVIADSRGPAGGAHAESRVDLDGAGEPPRPRPAAPGPRLRLAGADLGPSLSLAR